jgi:hypothetical protein
MICGQQTMYSQELKIVHYFLLISPVIQEEVTNPHPTMRGSGTKTHS